MAKELRDTMAQEVVPQLYQDSDPRVLEKGAEVRYEDGSVSVREIDPSLRAVVMRPDGVERGKESTIATFQSGYMMPPTSMLTDQFAEPLMEHLQEVDGIGVFWAPYSRGTENPYEDLGWTSAEEIRRHVAHCLKQIFGFSGFNNDASRRIVGGHSLGGQMALQMIGNPEGVSGFRRGAFNGALAYCPTPVPNSQEVLRNGSRPNVDLLGPISTGLRSMFKSILTGKGVRFSEEQSRDFFFGGEPHVGDEQVLGRTFGDSARYFLQTITTGSSGAVFGDLRSQTLAVMSASEDPIVTRGSAVATTNAFGKWGAGVSDCEVVNGGHFSPFYMREPDPLDVCYDYEAKTATADAAETRLKHQAMFRRVMPLAKKS